MKNDHELECIIDRLGQEIQRLSSRARTGEKAVAELAHFREAFGIAPETDLVAEFDRRARMADPRAAAPRSGVITPQEIDAAHGGPQ